MSNDFKKALDAGEKLLDFLGGFQRKPEGDDDETIPDKLRQKMRSAMQTEMEAWVNGEVEKMLFLLPEGYKDQARGMLRKFGEACYGKGVEHASKIVESLDE